MKQVGIRRFRLKLYQIIKGGLPVIVTRRSIPILMLTRVGKKKEEEEICDMCRNERMCTLRGIDLYGNVTVKWMCRRCEARLRAKRVIVI